MATTQDDYIGNGSKTNYTFTFEYLKETDVKVQLDATDEFDWHLANATTVAFDTAPGQDVKVKIYRETDTDTAPGTFYAGSAIKSEDLNDNFTQSLYASQEINARYLSNLGGTMTGDLTMGEDADVVFEGATDNTYETTLTVADPTADRIITLPNVSGTVITTGDTGTVTHTMLAGDCIDGDNIQNDVINSEHYAPDSIDTEHYAANSVDSTALAADAVTGAQIADNSIDSEHYVDGSIDTAHYAANSVNSTALAADAVTGDQLADNAVNSEHYVDGSIDEIHIAAGAVSLNKMANNSVATGNIVNDTILNTDINSGAAIEFTKLEDLDSAKILVGNGSNKATEVAVSGDVTISNTGAVTIAAGAIENGMMANESVASGNIVNGTIATTDIAADAIDSTLIAANAVTTSHIADAELTTLAGMQSGTASILADSTALAATITEINSVCENRAGETTITDSDAKIPTSGAVVDYVAAQIAPIGGLEVIANKDSFPETQPTAGVVISIADAGGIVVNGSGTSTTPDTISSDATVTINNINSQFNSKTIDAGVAMMVSSTGSGQIYNYHKATLKEADLLSLSGDINDFAERYRVSADPDNLPDKDEGDLVYDTAADKMKVYDSSTSAWKEVTSTGDFKYLVLTDQNTSNAATLTNTVFDLKENTIGGASASVTSAAQLLVSVNGVIQKANSGTGTPSEGFALSAADEIKFSTAPGVGSSIFIVQFGSALSITTPGDNTISEAKLQTNAVSEVKLKIHQAPSDGKFLKYTSANGMEWGDVPAGVGGTNGVDFNDDINVQFGTNTDMLLRYYNGGLNAYTGGQAGSQFVFSTQSAGTDATPMRFYTKSVVGGNAVYHQYAVMSPTNKDVALFYNGNQKFITTNTGVTVTGTVAATALTGDGSALTGVASTSANGTMYKNTLSITDAHTIAATEGAHSVGPITVGNTVTVQGRWVIS